MNRAVDEAGSFLLPLICFGVGALLICAGLSVPVAYRMGLNRTRTAMTYGWKGTVVTSLDALERADAGDTNQALVIVRDHMYASAMTLLANPETRDTLHIFVPDLKRYIAKHSSTNELDATPVERRLKQLLEMDASK